MRADSENGLEEIHMTPTPSFIFTSAKVLPHLPSLVNSFLFCKGSFMVIRFCMMWQNEKITDLELDSQPGLTLAVA